LRTDPQILQKLGTEQLLLQSNDSNHYRVV
jgi:hypothetical protein